MALDALTKAPVPDRVNAKLAAKQFEALVKQFHDGDNSRNSSPATRARSLSGGGVTSVSGLFNPEISPDGETSPGPSRLKRMISFRRNPTTSLEKNYTESVWLNEQQSESTEVGSVTGKHAPNEETNMNPLEIEKKQSALTLWRMSSGEGLMRDDDHEFEEDGNETNETDPNSPVATEGTTLTGRGAGLVLNTDASDSEIVVGDGDWSPYAKTRKKRGTITRRR
jgi:hypothetical protein